MNSDSVPGLVDTLEQLETLFGEVGQASIQKEQSFIHPHYRAMIEASPFAVLATVGPGGLDVSPRGDAAGFVVVEDERTLLLPERRGNNRVDSLRNLIADPRMALLFLIPGVGETLRVNGTARISVAPDLLRRFEVDGKAPKCVLVIRVETAFFQCARAIHRSRLWQGVPDAARAGIPSPGTMLADFSHAEIDDEQYDRELPERQRTTLY
ncbi:pyridoxamine 5'-phosphate oxidase family protein [Pseudoduganella sp. OTU4001]|uniref:pyridoxamine 5'-phosphate oxidase family protein n=1 Tax=Pseudoduganella sp. OTU4001 TaxID=3043854 RepID=UPI00313E592D